MGKSHQLQQVDVESADWKSLSSYLISIARCLSFALSSKKTMNRLLLRNSLSSLVSSTSSPYNRREKKNEEQNGDESKEISSKTSALSFINKQFASKAQTTSHRSIRRKKKTKKQKIIKARCSCVRSMRRRQRRPIIILNVFISRGVYRVSQIYIQCTLSY